MNDECDGFFPTPAWREWGFFMEVAMLRFFLEAFDLDYIGTDNGKTDGCKAAVSGSQFFD
jgi:hypothetical protein